MKLPNGYGSVYKLPGTRRKPWIVRITLSWTMEDGKVKQNRATVGSYETQAEALAALAEYHANPYDIQNDVTFADIYDRWSAEKYPKISDSNIKGYKASYKAFEPIYNVKFRDIRLTHLQGAIDDSGKAYPTLKKMVILLHQMYEYAIQNDIVDKDYSQYVDIAQYKEDNAEEKHRVFTPEEIDLLWQNKNSPYVGAVLMLIYSGLRIGELLELRAEDVDIEHRTFTVNRSKTAAGIRTVPIAEKTVGIWQQWLSKGTDRVITSVTGKPLEYHGYLDTYFINILSSMGIENHLPHDTRHTCVSLLQNAGVDVALTKRIVGHAFNDVTEKVYTHVDVSRLIEAINKI